MRVRLLPADEGGCGLYRMREPARIAAAEGHMVVVNSDYTIGQDPSGWMVPADQETRVINGQQMVARIDADVVVMQRPAKVQTQELIRLFQAQGTAVVVDVDDDISCLHSEHPTFDGFSPARNPDHNWHHIRKACGMADLVTVTTPALADRYGAHGRVAVLRNCVPRSMLERPALADGQTLGWGGRAEMHPGDLEATRGGVADALERVPGWGFSVIGPVEGVRKGLSLHEEPSATGGLEMDDYFEALGELDVGIVPLADSRFNAAKSGLKGLEYAARGVPFVASPLPEYAALAEEGIGVTASDRGRSWRRELVQLMDDESLRCESAAHARQVVEERHIYETESWRWTEAWGSALQRRRAVGHREAA